MTAIEQSKKYADEQHRAARWMAMLGQEYHGGGGGIGKVKSVRMSAEIYFQESNGSQNYHEIPDALRVAMQTVIHKNFDALVLRATTLMKDTSRELALKSTAEYADLLREAGISPSQESPEQQK